MCKAVITYVVIFSILFATIGLANANHTTNGLTSENYGDLHCKKPHIVLNEDGFAYFTTDDFIAQSKNVTQLQIRRAEFNLNKCGIADTRVFSDEIAFCCEDVGHIILVEVQGYDQNGSLVNCLVNVKVKDHVGPRIVHCLPDIIIQCDYGFDTQQLSDFGTIVFNEEYRKPIVINGEVHGYDGYATTNCNDANGPLFIRCEHIDDSALENCHTGTIIRKIVVEDAQGIRQECIQNITVERDTYFTYHDITWPSDTTLIGCVDVMSQPELTGNPSYLNSSCNKIASSYEDETFESTLAGCLKIIRNWTVIDWCQFETNASEEQGIWHYTQTILIESEIPPNILNCEDITLCTSQSECTAVFQYDIIATDDCFASNELNYNYAIYLFGENDEIISGKSFRISETLPIGTHRLVYRVNDRCNNESRCEISIKVEDCKAPSLFCVGGFILSLAELSDGLVTVDLWASEFVQKVEDNCTPENEIQLSFSADTTDQIRSFTCADIGAVPLEIWATDNDGNQVFCTTTILVEDHNGNCARTSAAAISGAITTENGDGIKDVQVRILNTQNSDLRTSDENGFYKFSNLLSQTNYQIIPEKNDDPLNGISTLDLVKIQRHILSAEQLHSAYKMIAADIDHSGHVSSADLVALKKLILGKTNLFENSNSWRFIDRSFPMSLDNFSSDFPEAINWIEMPSGDHESNFIGIKIGDVNETAQANDKHKIKNRTQVHDKLYVEKIDGIFHIKSSENQEIFGIQLGLNIAGENVSVSSGILDLSDDDYAINAHNIKISWSAAYAKTIQKDDILFSINNITTRLNILEYFDSNIIDEYQEEISIIDLPSLQKNELSIAPNPFTQSSMIRVQTKDPSLTFTLYNLEGKLITQKQEFNQSMLHKIYIDESLLDHQYGTYIFQIFSGNESHSGKLMYLPN